MRKYLVQFNKKLAAHDLYIRDVDADGNCMFRAVADQLCGDEELYARYRKLTIKQLKKRSYFFKDFLPENSTIDSYTARMSRDGTWGGHLELQAISDAFQVDIVVHTIDNFYIIKHTPQRTCWTFVLKCLRTTKSPQRQIHLAYHTGKNITNHYSSVRVIGDDTCTKAQQPPKLWVKDDSQSDISTADETARF